jgi:hypothetical protein
LPAAAHPPAPPPSPETTLDQSEREGRGPPPAAAPAPSCSPVCTRPATEDASPRQWRIPERRRAVLKRSRRAIATIATTEQQRLCVLPFAPPSPGLLLLLLLRASTLLIPILRGGDGDDVRSGDSVVDEPWVACVTVFLLRFHRVSPRAEPGVSVVLREKVRT